MYNSKNIANEIDRIMNTGKVVSSFAEKEMLDVRAYEMQSKVNQIAGEVYSQVMNNFSKAADDYIKWIRSMY
jgi:hypothetical protein